MNKSELIERLADKEHAGWAHWMKYLFSKCLMNDRREVIIPLPLVERWRKQAEIPYAQLSEREKQSDRDEVAHILPIIGEYVRNETILGYLKELAQGEAVRYASAVDGDILYDCPFCSPGSAYEPNEGQHEPTCLVIRAQQFLKERS